MNLCISCNDGYLAILNNDTNNSLYQNYYDCIKNDTKSQILSLINENINTFGNFDNYNYTSEEINKKIYEEITNFIINNIEILNKQDDLIIEGKGNIHYKLTSLENNLENKNSSDQFTKIDLGECENVIRTTNNLAENVSLLLLLSENLTSVSSERNTQFEIYDPVNKKRVNLSICQNIPINMYVPLQLDDKMNNLYNDLKDKGYDLFDINNEFYQDICTPYKSENGTDIPLLDRINYYYNNDQTQCQPGCNFSGYSMETQNLKCDCFAPEDGINNEKVVKEDSKAIYESFYDILKFSNYKILKCYKLVFKLNVFTSNIGSIITEIFLIMDLMFFVFYIFKSIDILKDYLTKIKPITHEEHNEIQNNPIVINEQVEKMNDLNITNKEIKENKDTLKIKEEINIDNNKKEDELSKKESINENKNNNLKLCFPPKRESKRKISLKSELNHQDSIIKYKPIINYSIKSKSIDLIKSNNEINKELIKDLNNDKLLSIDTLNKKIKKYDDYELNNMSYDVALKYDNRKFIPIYWSILRREHPIIFTFFIRNDYNLVQVKYSRLIFLLCTDMALNVFFFSDETMHKMFVDYGKYNLFQQIPQIIYSTIISQLIDILLCFLSLTDKHFYQIKELTIKEEYDITKILKLIKFKILLFYIITFIIFLFYWYIITSFCAVYTNTIIAFIKDSLLSFMLSLLYPFILYLLPSVLRIIAIKCNGRNLALIYKLSDVIPIF